MAPATRAATTSKDKGLWRLHGNTYDLTPFLDAHPGGKAILLATRGLEDATPLFESYHAFANRDFIDKHLGKYLVAERAYEPRYAFDAHGFYATLTRRVRAHFGATSANQSVVRATKPPTSWVVKTYVLTAVLAASWIAAFFLTSPRVGLFPAVDTATRAALAALAGFSLISVGFITMHDASHLALGAASASTAWRNTTLLRAWTALALWNPDQWMFHHAVRHHAFTGDDELDPDTVHAKPFVRKSLASPRAKYIAVPRVLQHAWFFGAWILTVFSGVPGMYVGQILSYNLIWNLKGHLWRMPRAPLSISAKLGRRTAWEYALLAFSLASHVVGGSVLTSLAFFVAANVAYAVCILPDHDTYESAVENHLLVAPGKDKPDWGAVQCANSADFGSGVSGRVFGELTGGINYQVPHHLFPSVCHSHLPAIAPIVEETCREFGVPYVRHPTVLGALWSVVKTVTVSMSSSSSSSFSEETRRPGSPKSTTSTSTNNNKVDVVTGFLFGVWLMLLALAMREKPQLALVVGVMVGGLVAHGVAGTLATKSADHMTRLASYIRASVVLSSVSAACSALAVDSPSKASAALLLGTGVVAADLAALVYSGLFAARVGRTAWRTMALVGLSVACSASASQAGDAMSSTASPRTASGLAWLLLGTETSVVVSELSSALASLTTDDVASKPSNSPAVFAARFLASAASLLGGFAAYRALESVAVWPLVVGVASASAA